MLSLDLWCHAPTKRDTSRRPLSFKEALKWLRESAPEQDSTDWRVEVLTAHVEQGGVRKYIIPLTRLVSALGFDPEDAGTVADTVSFDSYVAEDPTTDSIAQPRRFCLSDDMFGIYWTWQPSSKRTKVFMYGMSGEGTRQMQQVWKRVSASPSRHLSHPLLVGIAALEAEVEEMKRWLAGQSDELVRLHIQTGHHDYAGPEKREVDASKLTQMSKDACGLTINISTSVLCLQRIRKFAEFLITECEDLKRSIHQPGGNADMRLRDDLRPAQRAVDSRARSWRRRADALLDEAETWKHKAGILVQTVFTLATQRDTGISIDIAHDSRTLAQQATRDSTSMKAIAAVTMCFLPGTFVAVSRLHSCRILK